MNICEKIIEGIKFNKQVPGWMDGWMDGFLDGYVGGEEVWGLLRAIKKSAVKKIVVMKLFLVSIK